MAGITSINTDGRNVAMDLYQSQVVHQAPHSNVGRNYYSKNQTMHVCGVWHGRAM